MQQGDNSQMTVLSTSELQKIRQNARRTAANPATTESAGAIVHASSTASADSPAPAPRHSSSRSSSRAAQAQYRRELQEQMEQNRARASRAAAEDAAHSAAAQQEAEDYDYWRKPRPGGGTPNAPQYLADRGGDVAYRAPKKGMPSPQSASVARGGGSGHQRAFSTGDVHGGAANHSGRPSGGTGDDGERGFFDYFFKPRPGGGTPVRGSRGEVVANLRSALGAGGSASAQGGEVHQFGDQHPPRQQGRRRVQPSVGGVGGAFEQAAGGAPSPAVGGVLDASPIKASSNVNNHEFHDQSSAPPLGRRGSPLREQSPPPAGGSDTRWELAQQTIAQLQSQLRESLAAQREGQEQLAATEAQLDTAVALLEEYKELYGPLPPKQ